MVEILSLNVLNDFWNAYKLIMKQSPSLNSWRREIRREKYLFFPTLQEEERGKVLEVS